MLGKLMGYMTAREGSEGEAEKPKPEIPRCIRVAERIYEIRAWDHEEAYAENCYGRCDTIHKEIKVDTSYGEYQTATTLFHEILHAIYEEYYIDGSNQERTVRNFERGIMQVLADNVGLAIFLFERIADASRRLKLEEVGW